MMKRLIRYLKVQMTDLMALRKRMRKTKRRRLPSLRRSRNLRKRHSREKQMPSGSSF